MNLRTLFYKCFYGLFFTVEGIGGAGMVPWLMAPMTGLNLVKRRSEFPQFVGLRRAIPPERWPTNASQHYRKMICAWTEFLGAAVAYHRLGLPRWQERVRVTGTPPQALPEWGKRPVIVAFLHTGIFGLLRFWLRAQKLPTASYLGALPAIVDNEIYNRFLDLGDRLYNLEGVPHFFHGTSGLRASIRFLKPGHVLTIAIDGGKRSADTVCLDAGGYPFYAKKGACRLAAQTNAIVLPVSVRRLGPCRYGVHFGKPVPDELLKNEDFTAGTQFVLSQLWDELKDDLSDFNWTSLEALHAVVPEDRTGWP